MTGSMGTGGLSGTGAGTGTGGIVPTGGVGADLGAFDHGSIVEAAGKIGRLAP
jgi:hypothetical protein